MNTETQLTASIRTLFAANNNDTQLLLSADTGWLVLHRRKGDHVVACEVATDAHLSSDAKLSKEQRRSLMMAGYVPVCRASPRRHRVFPPEHPEALAKELLALMTSLYGAPADRLTVALSTNETEDIDSEPLMAAMRTLSKQRTHDARVALYQALLNARLLLISQDGRPRQIDTIGKWPIFGVFTDAAAMRHFDPRGTETQAMYGHDVFPLMMDINAGIVRINPDGLVGGELYRNEVEVLARAVQRFRK